jgi:hypothetical protein
MKKTVVGRKDDKATKLDNVTARIQIIMSDNNLTMSEFSDKAGLSRSTTSCQLSRGAGIGLQSLIKIVEAFPDYSIDWLLLGNGPKFRAGHGFDGCDVIKIPNPHGLYILSGSPSDMPILPFYEGVEKKKEVPLYANILLLRNKEKRQLGTITVDFAAEGDVAVTVGSNDIMPYCEEGDIVVLHERCTDDAPIEGHQYLIFTLFDALVVRLVRCEDDTYLFRLNTGSEVKIPYAKVTHIYNIVGRITPLRAMVINNQPRN